MSNSVVHPSLVSCDPDCEKVAVLQQLILRYGHEIGNQLTIILGRSELALNAVERHSALYSHLSEIRESARRIAIFNRKLLAAPEA